MRFLIPVCAATLAVAPGPLAAQSPRPYRPAADVLDYDLSMDLPDTGSVIHAVAVLTVRRTAPLDSLVLDLLDLRVDAVEVDGRTVEARRTPTSLVVPLPAGNAGTFKVSIVYGGAVKDGLIIRTDSSGRWTAFGDNWPNRARHWIPSIDHPSDKATVSWNITAPSGRTVVANGSFVSSTPIDGNRTRTKWRESQRIPAYLMVLAAAPLYRLELGQTACGLAEVQRCVEQSVYVYPEQRNVLPGPFARAGDIVELFSRLVGPFPYEKLAHLQSSTRFGGMENASAIFYADGIFRRNAMSEGLIAHETAHQWFGDAVTEREWPHVWLSEGFATYFAALWTRHAHGDTAFRREMSHIADQITGDTLVVPKRPVIDTLETDLLALLNLNSYQKGGFVLHMLRGQVGDSAFFRALRGYYAKHRHSTALSDDLRAEMERTSNQKLGWFFDQWLRRPGYPVVSIDGTEYDAATKQVTVRLKQIPRFGLYRFPLTVALTDSSGRVHRTRVNMPAADTVVRLRASMSGAPASVALDPDTDLLFKLAAP